MNVRRHLRRIGLVAALAAVAVPTAHADDWWRNQGAAHNTAATSSPTNQIGYPNPAGIYPDDRRGPRGADPTGLGNVRIPKAQAVSSQTTPLSIYPDDRRGPRGADPTGLGDLHSLTTHATSQTNPAGIYPDDRRVPRATNPTGVISIGSTRSPGFNWSDAAIGAAAGLGLALLLLSAFVTTMRRRGNRGRTERTVTA
jgi:hypothetical protein